MAYSELIKSFARIRSYMREFYVYGFKSREEYVGKSARTYDNERRRIESWLGEHMFFRQDSTGKNVFLAVDSRRISSNPLYKAFRAKSFTDRDITLHFYLMDLLSDGDALTAREITDRIQGDYLAQFSQDFSLDESTVRKKLREYTTLGLLAATKTGREVRYRRTDENTPELASWAEALAFFSEENPLGVIGSFLMDRLATCSDIFRFKHHYILHALDSEILCELLLAMDEQRTVELSLTSLRSGRTYRRTVCPLNIYISTQSGRQYLLGYHGQGKEFVFFRLDSINTVVPSEVEPEYEKYLAMQEPFDRHLWGVSTGAGHELEHLEMTIHYEPGEEFIMHRLEREKRHGNVEVLDANTCRFSADVYDATEMLPWIRTFIGRILELRCSNQFVVDTFQADLARMALFYGGDSHAVQ